MHRRLSWLGGVVALALMAGARPVSGYDWNGFKGGANLSRETVESTDYTPRTLAWQRLLDGPILASPTFVNGRVYAATRTGHAYCLDAATGATLWERVLGGNIDGTPTVMHGRVFLATSGGLLVCLDAATGSVQWQKNTGTEPMSSPVVTHGMVVLALGSPSRDIAAYRELTGEALWRHDMGQSSYSSPVEYRGLLYCASSSGDCFALDLNGQPVWKLLSDGTRLGGMSTLEPRYGNVYYVPGGWDYKLYCQKASDGSVLWSGNPGAPPPPGGGPPWSEAFLQEVLSVDPSVREQFLRDWGGRHQFDPEDLLAYQRIAQYTENPSLLDDDFPSQPPFTMPTTNAKPSSPAVGSHAVVFGLKAVLSPGTGRFSVICMNALTGAPRWWYQQVLPAALVACASTPAVARDRVLVGMANRLLTFDLSSGALLDTRTLDADIYSSPAIANGMVLVGTLSGSLYAFQTVNHAPAVPDGIFSPADAGTVTTSTPTLGWPAAGDPDPAHAQGTLRYLIEVDDDLELDLNADQYATAQGQPALVLPALANGTYRWRVRSADPEGALSPWSATRSFTVTSGQGGPLKDAVNFTAVPGTRQALLYWQDPPGFDGDGYRISWSDEFGQGYGPLDLGRTQSTTLANLLNGVTYTAQLKAYRNSDHAESAGVTAVFKPRALISLNGKEYASIEAALEDAKDGDTLLLGSGTIFENVKTKKHVSLTGVAPGTTILKGANPGLPVITVQSGGRMGISLMTLTRGTDGVLIESGGEADLQNLILMGLVNGVHMVQGAKGSVVNCTISDNSGHGVWMDAKSGIQVTALRNNIISYNGGTGILGAEKGDAVVSTYGDLFTNVKGDHGGKAQAGIGDISLDPLFVAKSPSDYRLKPESPCRDAADPADTFTEEPEPNGGRRDQGAYGGTRFGGPGSDAGVKPPATPGCFLSAAQARR